MQFWTLLQFWLPRVIIGCVLVMALAMRSAVPNPIYDLWLKGTKIDRLVTFLRFTIPWTLFCKMERYFCDMRIRVRQASGQEHTWFLLRDEEFGPIRISDKLSRLTLILYYREWPYFPERLFDMLRQQFEKANDPLVGFEATMYTFCSVDSAYNISHRLKPVASEVVFRFGTTTP